MSAPDPDPGRCRNYRATETWTGPMVRCLDYDGHDDVCAFPKRYNAALSSTAFVWPEPRSEPWVSPLVKDAEKETNQ